ncbi:MAG: ATP-binding cassette domain-containing protein [Steroidobacteraceae bacterium]
MTEAATTTPVLEARDLCREFRQGPVTLQVLHGASLRIMAGERLAIVGASGSGKTTLLQILGGLDRPTSGTVAIAGRDIHALGERARRAAQSHARLRLPVPPLLPEFSALENVAMPLLVRREPVAVARERAAALLTRVGLGGRLDHKPQQLGRRAPAGRRGALVTDYGWCSPRANRQPRRTERCPGVRASCSSSIVSAAPRS